MTIHIEFDSMIKFAVVVALLLLIVFYIYPFIKRKLSDIIVNTAKEIAAKKQAENPPETSQKQEGKDSILGQSKLNLRQSTPKAATDLETEKGIEKISTFVPSRDSDPEIKDIDVPLEKVEDLPEEEFDAESEAEELEGVAPDAVLASGVVYEDLAKAQQVIAAPIATQQEERDAGKVIYQNQKTDMFVQLTASGNAQTAMRISNLLDIHLNELAKEQQAEKQMSVKRNKQLDSKDFQDFDINSIF